MVVLSNCESRYVFPIGRWWVCRPVGLVSKKNSYSHSRLKGKPSQLAFQKPHGA